MSDNNLLTSNVLAYLEQYERRTSADEGLLDTLWEALTTEEQATVFLALGR